MESERRKLLTLAKNRGCIINWSHEGIHWFEVPMRMTMTFESHYFRVLETEIQHEVDSLLKHYQGVAVELAAIVHNTKQNLADAESKSSYGQYVDEANGGITDKSPDLQRIHNHNLPTEAQIAQADVDRKEE